MRPGSACICGHDRFDPVFNYSAPPKGEVAFDFSSAEGYRRTVMRCRRCDHYLSVHDMDMSSLYSGPYVDATYGADGLRRVFERVVALDPSKSDNVGRVRYVVDAVRRRLPDRNPAVLDVGAGTCVFLHRLHRETGWRCVALDPDQRAARHAQEVAGVDAICADFMQADDLGRFDLITFNKVIEHVEDPVAMLARSARFLNPGGMVYVELPDGEAAAAEGPDREEFYVDHHHVFSAASYAILVARAGFRLLELERLREPSTKFTLRGLVGATL